MIANLKTDEGCAILKDLAMRSDVLVEYFRLGKLAR